jgi:hypothetical protein
VTFHPGGNVFNPGGNVLHPGGNVFTNPGGNVLHPGGNVFNLGGKGRKNQKDFLRSYRNVACHIDPKFHKLSSFEMSRVILTPNFTNCLLSSV